MKEGLVSRCCRLMVACLIVVSLVTVGNSSIYADQVPGITDNSIRIGLILDQTGPSADIVAPATDGMKCYMRHINQLGGIHGRKIDARVEDDRYSIPQAIAAFKKLVYKDKVFALIGPTSTGAVTVLSRHVQKLKIPLLAAIMPEITVKPFKKYVFICADIYPNQMKVLIDYILKDLNPKERRIGLIYPDNETGKVDTESALKNLALYDIIPVSREVLNPGSLDASSQVMSLRRAKVSHIILCGHIPQPTIVLLRELKKYGVKTPVFGNWATCVEEVIYTVGEATKQFYSVNHMMSWYDDGPGIAKMREITLKCFPGTEKPYRGKIYTGGFVVGRVMVEILQAAGRDLSREGFIDAMEGIKDLDMGGLCGPISFSPTNHKGGNTWKIFKANPKTGKFMPMTGWRTSD
ncbi:MAG: ABC transporter substrate-binding protein [Thermodesulfobacteriota bacterium]|nr:ABC transporter substrate-binding protein [Thermodesulfobacteriota bacterium]